ncbi:MAG: DUF1131 domain-containing protein [Acidobacteriota bacterium]|nr:DUF1131 domain-containing protein [Acidobacteriota bacterium]
MSRPSGLRRGLAAAMIAASLLAAAGCSTGDPGAGASAAGVAPPEPSAAGGALGPITGLTPFSASELRSLFPAARVTERTESSEGEPYPVLVVEDEETLLLVRGTGDGAAIHSVEILGRGAPDFGTGLESGLGVSRGDTFGEVFPRGTTPECGPGVEEAAGQVACRAPDDDHLTLVFSGPWDGPDGELPPLEVLTSWSVARLIWKP